ncbi:hypothetical protein [Pedobacter sp. PACM 27299]|uniref:hypothetical protein n=1 Tax=Pedobacter sp. PACM 27299 TaxID=1727164 RepID=UPI001E2ECC18|nr:hypothetical protein [Pedobacter sp. PACM 27299]
MHSKDLIAIGKNPQRIFLLDAWSEAPLYSDRELMKSPKHSSRTRKRLTRGCSGRKKSSAQRRFNSVFLPKMT